MKRILFVQQHPPYGSLAGREGLDALLAGSAFVECSAFFSGDSLFQLIKEQQPEQIQLRNYSVSYEALPDYGVTRLLVLDEDLTARGLAIDDFLVDVQVLTAKEVSEAFSTHDLVLSF